jgi:enoyl-CoA hydratase/carnithine racemase
MTVNIKTEGHILLIEVDRSKKYNALMQEIYHQIDHAYFALDHNSDLRAGIL